jgi:hypothetical protein
VRDASEAKLRLGPGQPAHGELAHRLVIGEVPDAVQRGPRLGPPASSASVPA